MLALIDYLVSEPAHAHLSLVDSFAVSPEAIEIRNATLQAFAAHFDPAHELARGHVEVPAITAEATTGAIWQILYDYVENDRIAELPGVADQLTYIVLTPFVGPAEAAKIALGKPARRTSRDRDAPAAPDLTHRDHLTVEAYNASGGASAVFRLPGGFEIRAEAHGDSFSIVWPSQKSASHALDAFGLAVTPNMTALLVTRNGERHRLTIEDARSFMHTNPNRLALVRIDDGTSVFAWRRMRDEDGDGYSDRFELGFGAEVFDESRCRLLLKETGGTEVSRYADDVAHRICKILSSYSAPDAAGGRI